MRGLHEGVSSSGRGRRRRSRRSPPPLPLADPIGRKTQVQEKEEERQVKR